MYSGAGSSSACAILQNMRVQGVEMLLSLSSEMTSLFLCAESQFLYLHLNSASRSFVSPSSPSLACCSDFLLCKDEAFVHV